MHLETNPYGPHGLHPAGIASEIMRGQRLSEIKSISPRNVIISETIAKIIDYASSNRVFFFLFASRTLAFPSSLILLLQNNYISITWSASFRLIQYDYLSRLINRLRSLPRAIECILFVSSLLVLFVRKRITINNYLYKNILHFNATLQKNMCIKVLTWFRKCHIFISKISKREN